MKKVVFLDDLKESDIREDSTFEEYKRLFEKEAGVLLGKAGGLHLVPCPGCHAEDSLPAYTILGFQYHACQRCRTVFVCPRPAQKDLDHFSATSDADRYLRQHVLGDAAQARAEKVFSYRMQWIMDLTEEYLGGNCDYLDYRTRYPLFLNELRNTGFFSSVMSYGAQVQEKENLSAGIVLIGQQDIPDASVGIISAFEVIERVFDPRDFFSLAARVCKKNGLAVLTSSVSTGFEYQLLGEYSPTLVPFDRLNLFSLEALAAQLKAFGFELLEISTPGRLDVEIVKKTLEKNPELKPGTFWRYFFEKRDARAMHSLQEFLQQFQLSSHIRICAKKD